MKINNKGILNKEVDGTTVVRTTKKDMLNIIGNKYYCNILYLMLSKGFTYRSEIDKVLSINGRHYLGFLYRVGFIDKCELNDSQKKGLILIKNWGKIHLERLTTYELSAHGRKIIVNPLFYDLICEDLLPTVIKYKEELADIYNKKMEEITNKEEFEEKQLKLKYKIAKMKTPKLRTAEDIGIIQIVENA